MSIYGAMYSGVSGLKAQSNALGIISDNISNVNTVGYKGTRESFSTLVTQATTQTTYTPGGVNSQPMQHVDKQGLLQGTSNTTDLAISGNGMFVVNEASNPGIGDNMMFTRAGEFRPDENGDLKNGAGFFLQGWKLNDDGSLPNAQQSIDSVETVNISNLSGLPRATSEIEIGANLPSTAGTAAPDNTRQSTATIFDSLGNSHELTFTFTKTAANTWDVEASSPTLNLGSGVGSGQTVTTVNFDGSGAPGSDLNFNLSISGFASSGAATPQDISLNMGSAGEFDGLTNFASEFTGFSELNQNGLRFGNFTGVNIDEKGTVTAVFDNGRRKDIYQLPIAMFSNFNGLEERSGNAYLQTGESGDFLLSEAGVGGAGDIAPSALEQSTVDLATEFTRMITTQRAYSASTKVITTSDEMLQELTQAIR